MREHRYAVGQSVYFSEGFRSRKPVVDGYKIVRLLPSETDDCQYRVKNTRDGVERVVLESQLSKSAFT